MSKFKQPIGKEPRSRKVTMGYEPTIYKKFMMIAHIQRTSPTQILATYMEQFVNSHQAEIDLYESIYGTEVH